MLELHKKNIHEYPLRLSTTEQQGIQQEQQRA
jgi:hypothetical protein